MQTMHLFFTRANDNALTFKSPNRPALEVKLQNPPKAETWGPEIEPRDETNSRRVAGPRGAGRQRTRRALREGPALPRTSGPAALC